MLAKDPSRRYQTPAEVADALVPFCRPTSADTTTTAVQAAPDTQIAQRPPRRLARWLVAACFFLIAGAVIYVQTDRGALEIRSHEADIQVAVERDGERIDILDAKSKQQLSIRSGKYTLKMLGGDREALELTTDQGANPVTLTRGGKVVVEVRRVAK